MGSKDIREIVSQPFLSLLRHRLLCFVSFVSWCFPPAFDNSFRIANNALADYGLFISRLRYATSRTFCSAVSRVILLAANSCRTDSSKLIIPSSRAVSR